MSEEDEYGLSPDKETKTIEAPAVEYLPKKPWKQQGTALWTPLVVVYMRYNTQHAQK